MKKYRQTPVGHSNVAKALKKSYLKHKDKQAEYYQTHKNAYNEASNRYYYRNREIILQKRKEKRSLKKASSL